LNLDLINQWTDDEARASFLRCCGSTRWAEQMTLARPFESESAFLAAAERFWWQLAETDWLEAFAAHPRIGDIKSLREKFATTAAWASHEQAGAIGAGDDVLENLAAGNRQYEERFGFIFIVCATGKAAHEMLSLLHLRLPNDRPSELKLAAGEQMKITTIRLQRIAP
jgi:2-oxo-4-hydroxy-4-carboxy-5-ureidoimidazoline decarboxylase